jgi:hypothetical protein
MGKLQTGLPVALSQRPARGTIDYHNAIFHAILPLSLISNFSGNLY